MTYQIKFRRDTAANWTANNPVLAQGEPGWETDANRFKIGDGVNTWANLTYANIAIDSNITVTYGLTKILNNIEVNNTEIRAQANIAIDSYDGNINTSGNITAANFAGDGSGITGITTTQVAEGANLYFTTDRANTAMDNYLTSITANVDSVNGATGVVVLDTDDISEGSANLYFTTARANTAIGAYDGDINTTGNITAAKFTGNAAEQFGALAGNVVFNPTNLFANTIVNVQAALDDLQINKLNVSSLTSSVTFFSTTANSNVAGYTKLVTTTADPDYDDVAVDVPTGVITGANQLLANLISDPNVLTGNTTPINITTIGNIRKTAGGSGQNARFYFEVYKRTAANVETLIGTSDLTPIITSALYEEFSDIALITDTEFTETDTVVLKFYGSNVGGGSPEYDFQFGGTNPVRTLFPVPVSVIPVDNSADSIIVDTSGFSGILDGNDDTAQKAFVTIDALTTTELPEGTNLYFSNTRVNAFIQSDITTTDIDEGANLYYSNARVNAFIQSDITTTDIDEGSNLYFTTARANSAMDAYLTSITANVDSVNGATGVVVLDTDDISEGNANLYYTTARANTAIDAYVSTAVENANIKLKQFAETVVDLGNVTGDISSNIDLDLGSIFTMTATGNITINSMANASPGVSATLIVAQDATGDRLLTSNMLYAGNVRTLSTAANAIDIISVINAGNVYYAAITKGYE